MKKLFLGVLAIAGLVACVQEDVVNTPNLQEEIGFGGYVNGAVRSADPSTTTGSIDHFTVWAYADNSQGLVLEDELVSKSGDVWTYSNVQYWLKKHNYRFFALTPYVANQTNNAVLKGLNDPYANYLGGLSFTNVDGTEDLLYATAEVSTETSIPESVQFAFDHLLSKVKFTFVNGFTTDNIDLAVTNIQMVVPETASTTLGEQVHNGYVWTGHAGELTLDFGHAVEGSRIDATKNGASDNERLTFPAKVDAGLTYKVTFTVDQYIGTQTTPAATYNLETTITGVELVAGKAYNFVAAISHETLDLEAIEFEVTVDEWDSEDFDLGVVGNTEVKVVYSFDELQAVLNDAAARGVSVNAILGADIAGQVKVQEIPGVVTTIDGHKHTLTGAILVDGKSGYNGATTVVKNVNFVADAATLVKGDSFIWCGEALGTNLRYPDNITVENCTFTATGNTAVGVKVWSLNGNLVVKGCEADGVHSLMQLTSCGEAKVSVENVTIKNAKNGISLDNASTVAIKGANIASKEYGIRANADRHAEDAKTVIEETTITAKQPIVVRKVTKAGYALTLGAGVVLNTEELYDVIFTAKSDDVTPYVAPSVEFTYSSVAEFAVFPAVKGATYNVATAEDLADVLAAGATEVVLANNVDYGTITVAELKDVTIHGGENTAVQLVTTATSVIENVTVKDVDYSFTTGAGQAGAFVVINKDAQIENLVIEGCTIVGDGAKGSYGITGQNPNATVVVKNCNFSNMGYAIQTIAGGGYKSLVVEGCAFESIKSWSIMPQYGYTGDLTVNGCTFANCDGLVKTGTFSGIFTFTNNSLTNTNGHDGKDSKCFEVNANGTAVVAGNTKDGVEWIPASAQGLK